MMTLMTKARKRKSRLNRIELMERMVAPILTMVAYEILAESEMEDTCILSDRRVMDRIFDQGYHSTQTLKEVMMDYVNPMDSRHKYWRLAEAWVKKNYCREF